MIDKNCSKLMDSKCSKDYKSRHYWEKLGVINIDAWMNIHQIWKCSQCEMCVNEKLKFLKEVEKSLSLKKKASGKKNGNRN